ncbi:hypothetical protein PMAYCL1PPCAC_28945, partial [Pristionchus mayeri]
LLRFIQILSPRWEQIIFSRIALSIWIGVAIFIVLSFILILSSPWASITYVPNWYSWSYDYSLSLSSAVQRIEMILEVRKTARSIEHI